MRTLLIDDLREMGVDVTARTYEAGIEALRQGGWDILYLDHDLGCFDETGREYNGYDIVCWLEEHLEFLPGKIILVTANPVGRRKMQQVIDKLYGGAA